MIKGQSKAEYLKNYKRVNDIIDKSGGDVDKQIALASKQAKLITDEYKAINMEYRDYVLSKLLE